MKQLYIILFAALTGFAPNNLVVAQCSVGVGADLMEDFIAQLEGNASEEGKLAKALNFAQNYCLYSSQIELICSLFESDESRLTFATKAYSSSADPQKFYIVYNTFDQFSSAFQLHDKINGTQFSDLLYSNDENQSYNPYLVINGLKLPSYPFYYGPKGCDFPIREDQFTVAMNNVISINGDETKLSRIMYFSENNCLSVGQAMRLAAILENEDLRLTFLKYAFGNIYDQFNFGHAVQLLDYQPNQENLLSMIATVDPTLKLKSSGSTDCIVTSDQFNKKIDNLLRENFNSNRLSAAKDYVRKNCLNSDQIKEIVKLFEFETSKLEVAKFAYDYVLDPEEYSVMATVFEYESTFSRLNDYILSRD